MVCAASPTQIEFKVSKGMDEGEQLRVLITGSTKGIGRALAETFAAAGDRVLITARTQEAVEATVEEICARYGPGAACGVACDVRDAASVCALRLFASSQLGGVDVWINNAGSNGYSYAPLLDTRPETLKEIVDTNVYGTLLCSREAMALMYTQPKGGSVFNMEGAGSDGSATRKYAAYGFSKAGMAQLAKSLMAETKGAPVGVHTLSPGLVWTELVQCGQYEFGKQGRFFINAIAETPDTVAEDLVPKIRKFVAAPGASSSPGAVRFLTPDRALKKMYARIFKGENKDRFFSEDDPNDGGNGNGRYNANRQISRLVDTLVEKGQSLLKK